MAMVATAPSTKNSGRVIKIENVEGPSVLIAVDSVNNAEFITGKAATKTTNKNTKIPISVPMFAKPFLDDLNIIQITLH